MSNDTKPSTLLPSSAALFAGHGETLTLEPPEKSTTSRHRSSTVIVRRGTDPESGKVPLRFAMLEELGSGGMGVVMRARDPDLHREVAVKLLRNHQDPVRQARFLAEAQITGQLEHPNIIPVHEFGRDSDGRPWFAMKQIIGRDLAEILGRRKTDRAVAVDWPLTRLVDTLIQVGNAVAFAHSRGVIHRDLKPANVMIGGFGEVLVVDWGLGKVLDGSVTDIAMAPGEGLQSPLVTLDGAIVGTPCYMPPEQARGELDRLGVRTDVYALGAILSELITGRPPIQGASVEEVVRKAAQGEIDPPLVDWEGRPAPRELVAITRRAMAFDPEKRYPSAEALALDLRRWLEHRSVSAMDQSILDAIGKFIARHRMAALVGAIAGTVLVIGLIAGYLAKEEQRRQALAAQNLAETQRARAEQALQQAEEQRRQTESGRKREQALVVRSERQGHQMERTLAIALLGQADAALARGAAAECLRLLDRVAGEERDWSWNHVRALASGGLTPSVAVEDVLAVSPAGDGFAVVARSGRIRWLGARGGERQVQALGKAVACAAGDADGRVLVLAPASGGVRVLDGASGRGVANQIGVDVARALAVTGDGGLILTGSGNAVRFFTPGVPGNPGEQPLAGVDHLAVAPDRSWWAGSLANGGISLRQADGSERRLDTAGPVTRLTVDRNGRILAALTGNLVRAWSMPAGTVLADLAAGTRPSAIAANRSGSLLAIGSDSGVVAIWDLETNLTCLHLNGAASPVTHLAWSANGRHLAVVHADGRMEIPGE